MTAQERLAEEIEKTETWLEGCDMVWTSQSEIDHANWHLGVFKALQAVLAMPEVAPDKYHSSDDRSQRIGYNQALADMRAIVEGVVG